MDYRNILVLTTSSIEGVPIKKYLRPISAHIVVGANAFRDLFATLTDIFGGRSESYQDVLSSMYNEAIEQMQAEASHIGANCIVGLKIDIDEISGGGKSMFMITAVGTAVLLDKTIEVMESCEETNAVSHSLSHEKLMLLKKRNELIERAKNESDNISQNDWEFYINNKVTEAYPYLLKRYSRFQQGPGVNYESVNMYKERLLRFIDVISDKADVLYVELCSENNPDVIESLSQLIRKLRLLDLEKAKAMLLDEDFSIQKKAIRLLKHDKNTYNKEDLRLYKEIKNLLLTRFPERGQRTSKKQLLSSKEKEVWNCECGKANTSIGERCTTCTCDIYGFASSDLQPDQALKTIDEKIELLTEYLN